MSDELMVSRLIGENEKLVMEVDKLHKQVDMLAEINRKMFEKLKETSKDMHAYEDALHSLLKEE